ncbi:MAG: triose-phosphate isomerase, partial [Anaerolineae bacterium]|nr:triose-phosphate isomerase [Anaerolineae bacterium]
ETDEGVNKKAHVAFAHSLTPIICVGEDLAQNEAGETDKIVRGQVTGALVGLDAAQVSSLV